MEFSGRRADEGGERVHKRPHLTYLELIRDSYYVVYRSISTMYI